MPQSFFRILLLEPHGALIEIDLLAHLALAVAVLVLSFLFVMRERASRSSAIFFCIAVSVAIWFVGEAAAHAAPNEEVALWWAKEVASLGTSLLPALMLLFVIESRRSYFRLRPLGWTFLALSILLYGVYSRTDLFFSTMRRNPWGFDESYSLGAIAAVAVVIVAYALSAGLAWKIRVSSASRKQRGRSRLVLVGVAVSSVSLVDFLTSFGVPIYPFGYLGMVAVMAIAARIVWRFHLSEISPLAMSEEIIESMSEGLIVLDVDGTARIANESAARMLRLSTRDLVGRPVAAIPGLREAGRRFSDILRRGMDSFEVDLSETPPITLAISISVAKDRWKEPSAVLCLLRDITEAIHTERALRRERGLLQTVIDNLPEAVYLKDSAGRKILANPADVRWMSTFIPADSWLGKTDLEIFPPAVAVKFVADDQRVLTEGRALIEEAEYYTDPATGRTEWAVSSKLPVRDESGAIVGLVGIGRNITEAKLAEQMLRRLNRELRAISSCNQIIVRATDELAMMNEVCRVVCEEAGYLMAWVGFAERDETKSVRPVAWAGREEGYLSSAGITWADEERGRGIAGPAIRSGTTHYTQDIATDPRMTPWREQALARGYRSSIALPLKDEAGVTFGIFCVAAREPDAFTSDELRMLEELASDLAFGICAIRVRAERSRAVEALADSERRFRQVQKMEALGRLAGGVAHDFNNLLTVILSCAELVAQSLGEGDPQRTLVAQIIDASTRAASLTRQLLAFSRKQHLVPQMVDLNETIEGLREMLVRLIDERVELIIVAGPRVGRAHVDPVQLEQAIINLAINARDAMPEGGRLLIETANAVIDEEYVRGHPEARPGSYILIRVSDSGHGIDETTMAHIFEPFFTTKGPGKGTGLGLAMVYGFVEQSQGFIAARSEPGRGTTFSLYLPRADRSEAERADESLLPRAHEGTETVLLVEDEETLRGLLSQVLRASGYTVLEAPNGEEAVSLAGRYDKPIDLLVTDLVMPRMNGRRLAEVLSPARPTMRVLFMSGYLNDGARDGSNPVVPFLTKPITPGALTRKVREVLDGPPGDVATAAAGEIPHA